jgi:hypothetical protein
MNCVRCRTASWSVVSSRRPRLPAASSFPTPCRKSRWRARSSPSAPAPAARTANFFRWTSKAGDRVLFSKWSGTEVKLDGEELMIMKEADIIGVFDRAVAGKKAA